MFLLILPHLPLCSYKADWPYSRVSKCMYNRLFFKGFGSDISQIVKEGTDRIFDIKGANRSDNSHIVPVFPRPEDPYIQRLKNMSHM